MKNIKQEPAAIEIESNIPDGIMKQYPVEKIGETEGIMIEPLDIPERDLSDFDICAKTAERRTIWNITG